MSIPSANPLSEAAAGRRVVLGHDWLTGMRGGEKVLQHFAAAFPDAPIATLLANPDAIDDDLRSHPLACSFLQRIPGITRHYRSFLPLMPSAARRLRIPPADLLLTTSHCVAKSFRAPPGARHLCYCFTPMRYAWLFQEEYLGRGLRRLLAYPLLARLRRWDRRTSDGVDRFVAISRAVARRIENFYGRECDMVHPPVDTRFYTPHPDPAATGSGGFDLVVSALVPYKRVDLAVRAYSAAKWPLKVVGAGTGLDRLRAMAGPTVEFLGWRSNDEIRDLYRACRLLVFPGEEDFGIVPLEAMACGRPVVAYGRGGALETVSDGVSGLFFLDSSEDSLLDAVSRAAASTWEPAAIRAHAETFGPERFLSEIAAIVRRTLEPSP
ncbi:MAG: glycosyltransferase [Kiritimatiellia bacterium]|jgi:glycosyltransferase involved in cell wall biosynthesis